jgi:hypothetical protein
MVQILYRPGYFDIKHYETPSGGKEIYPEGYADKFIAKGRKIGTSLAACRFDHIRGFYDVPDATQFPAVEFNPAAVTRANIQNGEDVPF